MSADSIVRKGVYTKGFTLWARLRVWISASPWGKARQTTILQSLDQSRLFGY